MFWDAMQLLQILMIMYKDIWYRFCIKILMIALAVDILCPPSFFISFINSSIMSARKCIFHFSNPEACHMVYLSFPHTAMFGLDRSYQSCHLPSKSKWIDPILSTRLLFIVAGELKVWWSEGHLHCSRWSVTPWQSTKSIFHHSCRKEEDEFDAHGRVLIQLFWKDKQNGLATV